jgi:hypothetical protein
MIVARHNLRPRCPRVLPGARFRVGTIAFDVNIPDAVGFVGIRFRMQGAGDYEDYYFRPMNSGAPDATQYQPVFHGNTGWQARRGKVRA